MHLSLTLNSCEILLFLKPNGRVCTYLAYIQNVFIFDDLQDHDIIICALIKNAESMGEAAGVKWLPFNNLRLTSFFISLELES